MVGYQLDDETIFSLGIYGFTKQLLKTWLFCQLPGLYDLRLGWLSIGCFFNGWLTTLKRVFHYFHHLFWGTPRKINMEPKNHPIEKENHLPNHHSGSMLIFQGVPLFLGSHSNPAIHFFPTSKKAPQKKHQNPQGSKDLGKGLLEMACAPDGITEAWTGRDDRPGVPWQHCWWFRNPKAV